METENQIKGDNSIPPAPVVQIKYFLTPRDGLNTCTFFFSYRHCYHKDVL
jgi:hypothetical protein